MKTIVEKSQKHQQIKLTKKSRRLLLVIAMTIIALAIIFMGVGIATASPFSDYSLTYSENSSSGLIYGTIQANNANLSHTAVELQVVYQGVILIQKNFTNTVEFTIPMTTGIYTFQITSLNSNSSGSILLYQQLNGGLSSGSGTSSVYLTILPNVLVIGGLLVGQLIISFGSNLLFIKRLVSEGESIGEGIYKGTDDNEVYEHKKTLSEPMTQVNQVAEWLKQKRYINLDKEGDKVDENEK